MRRMPEVSNERFPLAGAYLCGGYRCRRYCFYANYLKYFERARTEWVRSRGVALRGRLEEGIAFVVHSLNIRYHQPAFLDDELEVSADLISATRTAMTFRQEAWRREDGAPLVSGRSNWPAFSCHRDDPGGSRRT